MNEAKATTHSMTASSVPSQRGAVLRVLLPVFLVAYAALPIAVARHSG